MKRNLFVFSILSLVVLNAFGQRSIRAGLEFPTTRVVEYSFLDESSIQNQAVYFAKGDLITTTPICECESINENSITLRLSDWWIASNMPVNRVPEDKGITKPEIIIEIDQFLVKKAELVGMEENVNLRINRINTRLSTFNFDQVGGIQAAIKVELPFNRNVHFRVVCAKSAMLGKN